MSMDPFQTNREDPTDPVGLLLDCHKRIRHFTGVAQKMIGPHDADDESVRLAAESVARYFEKALPLHAEDEDDSLLPRLEGAGVACETERMHAEHAEIHSLIGELLPSWKKLIANPASLPELREPLAGPTQRLSDVFDKHLAYEEAELFPHVRDALEEPLRRKIFAEMRARRAR